jgi:hypothetical protein
MVTGICGNYDGNPDNEYLTPSGEPKEKAVAFAESWRVGECEVDVNPPGEDVGPCTGVSRQYIPEPQEALFAFWLTMRSLGVRRPASVVVVGGGGLR